MSDNSEERFLRDGFIIDTVEDRALLDRIRSEILTRAEAAAGRRLDDLSRLHEHVTRDHVNDLRLKIYGDLNGSLDFLESFYSLARCHIDHIVGNELAAQQQVNVSILMPHDDGSQLKLHSDTMSGQSEYECVLWVPFTDVHDSNSMYVLDFDTTREMFARLADYHTKGMDAVFEDYKDRARFMNLQYGQFMLFTPTLFHGSIINTTDTTRVSMNVRFKGLFTPYYTGDETEKRLGSFYRPFKMRPATVIGLRHQEPTFE